MPAAHGPPARPATRRDPPRPATRDPARPAATRDPRPATHAYPPNPPLPAPRPGHKHPPDAHLPKAAATSPTSGLLDLPPKQRRSEATTRARARPSRPTPDGARAR